MVRGYFDWRYFIHDNYTDLTKPVTDLIYFKANNAMVYIGNSKGENYSPNWDIDYILTMGNMREVSEQDILTLTKPILKCHICAEEILPSNNNPNFTVPYIPIFTKEGTEGKCCVSCFNKYMNQRENS